MNIRSDRIVNILIIITCLVVIGKIARSSFHTSVATEPQYQYKKGTTLTQGDKLDIDHTHVNVLLATASACHFCKESIDNYRS